MNVKLLSNQHFYNCFKNNNLLNNLTASLSYSEMYLIWKLAVNSGNLTSLNLLFTFIIRVKKAPRVYQGLLFPEWVEDPQQFMDQKYGFWYF